MLDKVSGPDLHLLEESAQSYQNWRCGGFACKVSLAIRPNNSILPTL